jgi:hypothetical protein
VVAIAALPAAGKEGVEATLLTSVPRDAAPGERLRVEWTLTYLHEDGKRKPFGAGGVFVRLRSASGAAAKEGFDSGRAHPRGEYAATVVIPEGGVGKIEIGLRGWATGPGRTRRADVLFPITSALLGASPPVQPGLSEQTDGDSTAWIVLVGLVSLLTVCVFAVAVVRRKRAMPA